LLQDGHFSRIGDSQERRLEARVVCSSNRKLEQEALAGNFRSDLFYRINVICIRMPLLSERREDIPVLVNLFLSNFCKRFDRRASPISTETMHYLQEREWLGNLRELENCVARYVILGSEDVFRNERREERRPGTVAISMGKGELPLRLAAKSAIREMEQKLILKALQESHWNRRMAAQALKISYRALMYKIRGVNLSSKRPRGARVRDDETAARPGSLSE
jgi:DNA-binding NtrC family response regulator